jgi:hypothetical protein
VEALITTNGGHDDPVITFFTGRKIRRGDIVRSDRVDHFASERLLIVKSTASVDYIVYRTYVLQPSLSAGFLSS